MSVLKAGSSNPVVTYPNEVLYDAAARMLRSNIGRLPVASWEEPGKPVGYLGRSQIMAARMKRLDEEYVREPGLDEWKTAEPQAGVMRSWLHVRPGRPIFEGVGRYCA